MINCIAVDDEPLALGLLADNISKVPYLNLIQKCRNAFEALAALETADVHLIFLDVQMPRLSGLHFLNALQNKKPMVILVTAYEQYALEGFNLNVTDYLMKPVAFDRFYQACQKAKELFELRNKEILSVNMSESEQNAPQKLENMPQKSENTDLSRDYREGVSTPHFFFVNVEYSLLKILSDDILYIEGMKDYIKIHLASQTKAVITRLSFKAIEDKLPMNLFFRVHKSFMVNLSKIQSMRNGMIYINKHEIPLSDAMREDLMRKLNIN